MIAIWRPMVPPRPSQITVPAACRRVFAPQQALGEPCQSLSSSLVSECREGVCSDTAACPGECVPAPGLGASCTGACDSGLQCLGSPETKRCVKAEPELADVCRVDGVETQCGARRLCGPDDRCKALAVEGEACSDHGECRTPFRCLDGICDFPRDAGGGCSGLLDCVSYLCIDGVCIDRFSRSEGETCGRPLSEGCKAGLYCSDEVCVSQLPIGSACGGHRECVGTCGGRICQDWSEEEACNPFSNECPAPLRCWASDRTSDVGACLPTVKLGQPCDDTVACERPANACVDGRCVRRVSAQLGEWCGSAGFFAVGCFEGICVDGRCQATSAAEGQRCWSGNTCEPGLHCVYPEDGSPDLSMCVPSLTIGEACRFVSGSPSPWSSICGSDGVCVDGACVAKTHGLGDPCTRGRERETSDCVTGLWCVDGQCKGPAGEAESCTNRLCAEGLSCLSGTCVADTGTAGERCATDSHCQAPLACIAQECTALRVAGQRCETRSDPGFPGYRIDTCGPGLFCAVGENAEGKAELHCAPAKGLGESCEVSAEIPGRQDSCDGSAACVDGKCVARGAPGEVCVLGTFERPCARSLDCTMLDNPNHGEVGICFGREATALSCTTR